MWYRVMWYVNDSSRRLVSSLKTVFSLKRVLKTVFSSNVMWYRVMWYVNDSSKRLVSFVVRDQSSLQRESWRLLWYVSDSSRWLVSSLKTVFSSNVSSLKTVFSSKRQVTVTVFKNTYPKKLEWMGHVAHMNASCHAYEWVMSHL